VWSAAASATYTVTVQDDGNGTGSASPNPAAEGETVTLSNTPDAGYQLDEWQVVSGGVSVTGNTFTMPANDVTVKAVFEAAPPPAWSAEYPRWIKAASGWAIKFIWQAGGRDILVGSQRLRFNGSMTLLATARSMT
jgi:hypothetical protein